MVPDLAGWPCRAVALGAVKLAHDCVDGVGHGRVWLSHLVPGLVAHRLPNEPDGDCCADVCPRAAMHAGREPGPDWSPPSKCEGAQHAPSSLERVSLVTEATMSTQPQRLGQSDHEGSFATAVESLPLPGHA